MTLNLVVFVIQFTREKLSFNSIRFVMRCQMSASSRMTSSWEMTLVLPNLKSIKRIKFLATRIVPGYSRRTFFLCYWTTLFHHYAKWFFLVCFPAIRNVSDLSCIREFNALFWWNSIILSKFTKVSRKYIDKYLWSGYQVKGAIQCWQLCFQKLQ